MSKEPYDPMDLKSLRCFEAMAKHGSLTRASIELGISDAAVSQRIKSLERRLGAKLYESRGGRVRLTEAGQRTKDLATRLFDELAEFEEAIGDEESRGTVALSAEAPLLRYHLPEIAPVLRSAYGYERKFEPLLGDFRSRVESRPSISTSAFLPITSSSTLRADVSTQ